MKRSLVEIEKKLDKIYKKYKDTDDERGESKGIIGSTEYRRCGVVVPIIYVDGKTKMVFQKRSRYINQGSEISFPGGVKEKADKDLRETAIRECSEELGIPRENFKKLYPLGRKITGTGTIVEGYIALIDIDSLDDIKINEDEVERIIVEDLRDLQTLKGDKITIQIEASFVEEVPKKYKEKLSNVYEGSWKGRERSTYFYLIDNEVVWGITGEILKETLEIFNK